MGADFDFLHPWVLALLPLALLPLFPRRADALRFPDVAWLPPDRPGRIAGMVGRVLAVLTLAGVIVGLAGPGRPQTEVVRSGRGAEIMLLLDRSSSMNDAIVGPNEQAALHTSDASKSEAASELLAQFVGQRPHDRFAYMMFSTSALPVLPFTEQKQAVRAGIAASRIGRGLANTDIGRALLAAIRQFDGRSYSGSRIILLVSDGGGQLDPDTRQRVQAGLARNRVALYWLYLRTGRSPGLADAGPLPTGSSSGDTSQELALHRFFQGLHTPYRLYEAEDAKAMSAAIAEVGRQQNLPLSFNERVPRQDAGPWAFAVALAACVLLLALRCVQLRSWA